MLTGNLQINLITFFSSQFRDLTMTKNGRWLGPLMYAWLSEMDLDSPRNPYHHRV